MKLKCLKSIYTGLLILISGAANAGIIPVGIQTNLTQATIDNWGWTECGRSSASSSSNTIQTVVNSCSGEYTMMAAWDASLNVYGIAAAGKTGVVTNNTFANSNDEQNFLKLDNWSNGVNFYKTAGYGSWGFTSIDSVYLNSADINLYGPRRGEGGTQTSEIETGKDAIGLSWHVSSATQFGAGWGYNATGGDNDWMPISYSGDQRVFFTTNKIDVPEPSTLAIFALGMIGLASRRFKKHS